jgi:hypothetical protein
LQGRARFALPTLLTRPTGKSRIRAVLKLPVVPICRSGQIPIFGKWLDFSPNQKHHPRRPALEKRDDARGPWVSVDTRPSLRPLFSEGLRMTHHPDAIVPREREAMFQPAV